MTSVIDGKAIAKEVLAAVAEAVSTLQRPPCLAAIIVGDDPASDVYVTHKQKACAKVGMTSKRVTLPADSTKEDVLQEVIRLNADPQVNGIIVQLPLPSHQDANEITSAINPKKDVDCLHPSNVGKVWLGTATFMPCTPMGVMTLLEHGGIEVEGKHAVIIGRSAIVGKPIASLLLAKSATITMCHSRTKDLGAMTRQADIIIAAAGRPGLVTGDMIKEGAVVIDVGITRRENKLSGDVDMKSVLGKASHVTPVPGGVGPMTVAMLIKNTLIAAQNQ